MNHVQDQCTDPGTGRAFRRFVSGEVNVNEEAEQVRLHTHAIHCRACLRYATWSRMADYLLALLDKEQLVTPTEGAPAERP